METIAVDLHDEFCVRIKEVDPPQPTLGIAHVHLAQHRHFVMAPEFRFAFEQ